MSSLRTRKTLVDDLKDLLATPSIKAPPLKSFLDQHPSETYLRNAELWKPYVLQWIQSGNMGPVYYYLMLYKDQQGGFQNMHHLLDYLTQMHASGKGGDLFKSGFFKEMHDWLNIMAPAGLPQWWNLFTDVLMEAPDPAYLKALMTHTFPFYGTRLFHEKNIKHLDEPFIRAIAAYMIQTQPTNHFKNGNYSRYSKLLTYINTGYEKDIQAKMVFYITSLIESTPRNEQHPTTFNVPELEGANRFTLYSKSAPLIIDFLETFITTCITKGYTSILNAIYARLDMNHPANQHWLDYTLRRYIAYNNVEKEPILKSIIMHFKLNVNNIYIQIEPIIQAAQEQWNTTAGNPAPNEDPIRNPYTWMHKNIPVITYAFMYENARAVKFFILLGANLDRCAFSLQDFTQNPELLQLFHARRRFSKIQEKWREYYYNPEHTSQEERQRAWKQHLASLDSNESASRTTSASSVRKSGGRKKK